MPSQAPLLREVLIDKEKGDVKQLKFLLILGILANVALLGYYKYTDFFIENINLLTGANFALKNIAKSYISLAVKATGNDRPITKYSYLVAQTVTKYVVLGVFS